MGHKQKMCLKMQAQERFKKLTCLGRSKHEDKVQAGREYDALPFEVRRNQTKQEYINNAIRDKIYSSATYRTYAKHNNYFFAYCEEKYPKAKTLEQCRQYCDEWLQKRVDEGLSAYTIATEKAGLAKLYGEPATNFLNTPSRKRDEITRSRGYAKRDYGFNLEKHEELINFCRGTGLRRSELESLRGTQLRQDADGRYILLIKGKGGRHREAPIIGEHTAEIVRKIESAGDGLVWGEAPSHMDVHSYRSDYATAIYTAYARDKEDIPMEERYYCRGDRKGEVMDKPAMLRASKALGHGRLEVVAGHYIR